MFTADGATHDLQILELEVSDNGFYKCSVGPDEYIISHVIVLEKETLPFPEVPDNINITDCCISKEVSQGCLPACHPPDIDLDSFNITHLCSSPMDVLSLMDCLTDGSNHDTCCLTRGVHRNCLDLCHNSVPSPSNDISVCLEDSQINAMLSCAVTGADIFPSEPTSVSAVTVNTGSPAILVKWGPPEKNAQSVTGYKIMYRRDSESVYSSILIHDPGVFTYRLTHESDGIIANKAYIIHVVAIAEHGISLGSIEINIYVRDDSVHDELSKSVDDCCDRRDVSTSCRSLLCRSQTYSEFHTGKALDCFPFLDDIFTCLAGERNHTGCCSAYGVTSECSQLCSGEPPSFDYTLAGCVAQMSIVEACVQEGYTTLPAPPSNLRVQHVTNNLAQLSFDPPETLNVVRYVVQVRERSDSEPFTFSQNLGPSEFTFEMTQLAENTMYWVRVTTETADHGSLPSETVSFLTHTDEYEQPVEIPTQRDPYNLTDCCVKSGMPLVCAIGCVYRANMTDYYSEHLADCYSSIGSVLACASDGRDHRECCQRRNINEACEDLCVHTKPGPLDAKYVPVCVPETSKAVLCYNEGLVRLPRYPNVKVTNVTALTISLAWSHPPSGSIVDFYNVSVTPVGGSADEVRMRSTQKTVFIVQDLRPATEYTINVFSINENGTSAPSPSITIFTLEDVTDKSPVDISDGPRGRAFWQNITDCCENTVSKACRDICLNKESTMDQTNACFSESTAMLACFADGEDHRFCCEEKNLPSVCVPICGGNAGPNTLAQATCMSYTHRDIILSCFLERHGLIPGAPLGFSVMRSTEADLNISLSWNAPDYCAQDCYYTVYYWNETSPEDKVTKETTAQSMVIAIDTPNQDYTFMVVAHNSYGSGPPSSKRTLFISEYARDVKVYLSGDMPYVEIGNDAMLVCSIAGFPQTIEELSVKFIFKNRRVVSNNRFLYLNNVDSLTDEGLYTCEVTDYFTTSSASFYLPVKAKPIFDQLKIESSPPGINGAAKVACWFRGFPDSDQFAWIKDGRKLQQDSSKLSMARDERYHTGITSYRVKIANVVESDYGEYSISVSNKFGSVQCHVNLRNPANENNITTAPAVSNPPECCAKKGVTPLCQELCGYHVNVVDVLSDSRYITCLGFFDTFISCGADGRDHTKCCQESAVLPFCQAMCKGVVPASVVSDQEKLLQCLGDWQPIVSCMKTGTGQIPFSPMNVSLSVLRQGQGLTLSWTQPLKAADKVDHYTIYYTEIVRNITKHVAVSQNVLRYQLMGLMPMTLYRVWMTAGNKFGNSLPSLEQEIETFSFELNRPTGMTASTVPGTTDINLRWNMARLTYYYSFSVYYKEISETFYKQVHNVHGTEYTLTDLKPKTSYKAYVEGIGPVVSQKSQIIEFSTIADPSAEKQEDDDFDGEKVALGLGITVAVIAFIAIILLVLFFIFKSRQIPPKVDDTVAFENPRYGVSGSVKLHGLEDPSFNYGQLHEEGGAVGDTQDQQYTYDNSGFVNNNSDSVMQGGESNTDSPGYDNPMYPSGSMNDSVVSNGDGQDSVATLELSRS
ncbi:Ig-like and fibronectin type-iii domain-containing protein c25g4.10 isoform x1 [Plakobranchus ocellatus]|uniref:Ig-like and fibronectin type-iii domain-containing protein c25g4.10 isoform x1 n=1 Tax=Plakobranchus ocellatus TaxID=259542 RepID=A0AAV4DTQ2_9GAST|nr:Ig-like and fibronectin type-iii domain-containing protein c25g4.10 isoform x1 [Plakobranchus ocellatus]